MKKIKKVALITPSLAKGGIEKVVTIQAKQMQEYYDVYVIVMDNFRTDYEYSGKKIELGLSWENRNIIYRLYNFILAIIRLKKLAKKEGFDTTIAHGELASFPSILGDIKNLIVVVHENRLVAKKDFQGKLVNIILKYLFSKRDLKLVTVSKGIGNYLSQKLDIDREKIKTIHNAYNIREIATLSRAKLMEYEDIFKGETLIAVGRLIPAKGHWYLLRVFSKLKEIREGIKLVIVGEGILYERLLDLSKNLGLKTYSAFEDDKLSSSYDIYFLGFHKNPFKFIANSTLFVMPSVWEGFGNTIVEAMACEIPVLVSNCPSGPAEIVAPQFESGKVKASYPYSDEFGVLMPPFKNRFVDESEPMSHIEGLWVDTINSLLDDEKKLSLLAKRGRERANDFDIKKIIKKWREIIDNG